MYIAGKRVFSAGISIFETQVDIVEHVRYAQSYVRTYTHSHKQKTYIQKIKCFRTFRHLKPFSVHNLRIMITAPQSSLVAINMTNTQSRSSC